MKTLLNRTQLASRLGIAPRTLAIRISTGKIKPVAMDGQSRELFAEPRAASAVRTPKRRKNPATAI